VRCLQCDLRNAVSTLGWPVDLTPWARKNLHLIGHKSGLRLTAAFCRKACCRVLIAAQKQGVKPLINFALLY
jgi:hypothetical protein